jgi:hypothetical protein
MVVATRCLTLPGTLAPVVVVVVVVSASPAVVLVSLVVALVAGVTAFQRRRAVRPWPWTEACTASPLSQLHSLRTVAQSRFASPDDLTTLTWAGHALVCARALQSYAAAAFALVRAAVTCALGA